MKKISSGEIFDNVTNFCVVEPDAGNFDNSKFQAPKIQMVLWDEAKRCVVPQKVLNKKPV